MSTGPWSCFENLAGLSAVPSFWREGFGPLFEPFRAMFLEPSGENARFLPCPNGCGCDHEVIQHGPDDIVAVCRCDHEGCPELAIEPADILCWSVSWTRFGRALCRCFGLNSKLAELGVFNTRQIGAWSSSGTPVLLTLQPDTGRFLNAIAEITSKLGGAGFIMLAPTARYLDARALDTLARAKAAFFDLQSYVILSPSGQLSPACPPGELFRNFSAQAAQLDKTVFEHAFGLVKALKDPSAHITPDVVTVFAEYCIAGKNAGQIAKEYRCSRGTILKRLQKIKGVTGREPDALRQFSGHIGHLENQMHDSRASHLHRRNLIDDADSGM